MTVFNLPDLGEGLHEAELVAWHVAAGDHVVADQPLASVETDKAVVEIPSPRSGHVARLCAKPGERMKTGQPLVVFADAAHADEGTVVGHLPETKAPPPPPPSQTGKAMPAVRARAKQLGIDLANVTGTGPDGSTSIADVEAAAHAVASPAGAGAEKLSALRRTMAEKMAQSHAQVVPATVMDDADIGAWHEGDDPMLRLVRAVAAACAEQPALNAWYDGRAQTLERHPTVDLGVAVDTEAGLIVPVLRDAGTRDAAALGTELARLKDAAHRRTLSPADLRDATITLSNFGALAGRYAQLVIVPPQVAILGAGRIRKEGDPAAGRPVRRMLPLSLTFDHRAVTGGEATRFLMAAIADLQRPK